MARKPVEDFVVIPQAPLYELNSRGVLRNRKTGKILKWTISPSGSKAVTLCYNGYKTCATLPNLLWQIHGRIISKKAPVPVTLKHGTRTLRFDSCRQCSYYLATYHGLSQKACQSRLVRRCKRIGGWDVHYCYEDSKWTHWSKKHSKSN